MAEHAEHHVSQPDQAAEIATTLGLILRVLAWGGIVWEVAIVSVLPAHIERWLLDCAAITGGSIALGILARNGRVLLASRALIAGAWLLITGLAWNTGGLEGPAVCAFPIVVLLAALLSGPPMVLVTSTLCTVSALAIGLADHFDVLPPSAVQHTPLSYTVSLVMILGISAFLVQLGTKAYGSAVLLAREEYLRRRRLADRHLHLTAIVESSGDAIISVDRSGSIFSWNRGAERLYGYPPEEALGKTLAIIGGDRSALDSVLPSSDGTRQSTVTRLEAVHTTRSGTTLNVALTISPIIDSSGSCPGASIIARDITDSKQAQERLIALSERFKLASEAAGIAFWDWNLVTDTIHWNGRLFDLHGIDPSESGLVTRELWLSLIHPEDRGRAEDALGQVIREEGRTKLEYRVVRPDGSVRHLLGAQAVICTDDGQPLRIVGLNKDITQRKVAEETLRRSLTELGSLNQQLRFHVSRMPLAYVVHDRHHRICEWNPMAERIFGWSAVEAIGKKPYELTVPPDQQEAVRRLFADIHSGTRITERLVSDNITKDGRRITCEWFNSPLLGESGEVIGCLSMANDITDRKRGEIERERLEGQLRQSHKMQALGTLAGGVAHDFNNILTAIAGNVEIALKRIGPTHPAAANLVHVSKAASRAAELVRQILTYTRRQESHREAVRVESVVDEALKLLHSTLPPSVRIDFSAAPELPSICADAAQIHQIVMNLGTNAAHAMAPGGGTLRVAIDEIELDEREGKLRAGMAAGRYVRITVSDSGCGMDRATLERIFDPFFTTKRPGHGTGLGLSVVHGIVQSHKGSVHVTSEIGRGSSFDVYFPALSEAASAPAEPAAGQHMGRGEHILIVDDEEALTHLIGEILTMQGYRVTAFNDPVCALEAFAAQPEAFDVVVTDLSMPTLSGPELTTKLLELRPSLPIVMMTGFLRPEYVDSIRALGIVELVQKPDIVGSLLPLLEKVLERAPARRVIKRQERLVEIAAAPLALVPRKAQGGSRS